MVWKNRRLFKAIEHHLFHLQWEAFYFFYETDKEKQKKKKKKQSSKENQFNINFPSGKITMNNEPTSKRLAGE